MLDILSEAKSNHQIIVNTKICFFVTNIQTQISKLPSQQVPKKTTNH